jgi:hypothetical protein
MNTLIFLKNKSQKIELIEFNNIVHVFFVLFNSESNRNILSTGSRFTTPFISETTTYWLEDNILPSEQQNMKEQIVLPNIIHALYFLKVKPNHGESVFKLIIQ